jgi:hypothetical protein
MCAVLPYRGAKREGQQRVDMIRSPRRQAMPAPLRIAVAVSGASRDRVLTLAQLDAAREPQNDVGITLTRRRLGSADGR